MSNRQIRRCQRFRAQLFKFQQSERLRHLHTSTHKPLKWLSASAFILGSSLEHWVVLPFAGTIFISIHVLTWVLAE